MNSRQLKKELEPVKYTKWEDVPENLKTRTQLRRDKLKPAKDAKSPAYIQTGMGTWNLYDISDVVPLRVMSPTQLEALARGRKTQDEARRTCPNCKQLVESVFELQDGEWAAGIVCADCDHRAAVEFFDGAYNQQVLWARGLMERNDWVILDTETTDLAGYIVEIGIIGPDGSVVLSSLLNPEFPIEEGARQVHGITEAEVANAPTFAQIESKLREAIEGRTVVVYNAAFDSSVIEREIDRIGGAEWSETVLWDCVMESYARFVGEWNHKYRSFRWQRLNGGHRAVGDCLACLNLIKEMAEAPLRESQP